MLKRNIVFSGLLTVLLLAGCASEESQVQGEKFQTYSIELFLETTSVRGGAFNSGESKLLIHSNSTGIFNVYSLDLASGEQNQLTDSQDTTYSVAYLPGSESFLFTRDEAGNELYKLYLQDETGGVRRLTQGANDPRVLQVESDEMVENLRQAGGTVEYVLFDDEGHGFTKTENRIRGWETILKFLKEHL